MAASILTPRMSGEIDGDVVILLIGMRVNAPWKVHKWWPVFRAMRPILAELSSQPESGFLGHTFGWPVIVQYWRSFDHLEVYARSHDHLHWPAWVSFNQLMRNTRGDVGIWHETYQMAAGQYEAFYSGMPAFGLGRAAGWSQRAAAASQPAGGCARETTPNLHGPRRSRRATSTLMKHSQERSTVGGISNRSTVRTR